MKYNEQMDAQQLIGKARSLLEVDKEEVYRLANEAEPLVQDNPLQLGWVYYLQGRYILSRNENDKAAQLLDKAIDLVALDDSLVNEAEGVELQSSALCHLAVASWRTSQYDKAYAEAAESYELAKEVNEESIMASALTTMALVFEEWGLFDKAAGSLIKSIKLFEKTNFPKTHVAYNNLSNIYWTLGEHEIEENSKSTKAYSHYQSAFQYLRKALEGARAHSDNVGEALYLGNFADGHRLVKEYDEAIDCANQSLALLEKVPHRPDLKILTLGTLGQIHTDKNDPAKGLEYFKEALSLLDENPNLEKERDLCIYSAEAYLKQGNVNPAKLSLTKALHIAKELKTFPEIAKIHLIHSKIYEDEGEFKIALTHYKNYHEAEQKLTYDSAESKLAAVKAEQLSEIKRLKKQITQQQEEVKQLEGSLV